MTDEADGSIRIGTTEREAAITALGDHLTAGRLDIDEYGERSAQASVARTRDDLTVLFTDLPEPRPSFRPPHTETPGGRATSAAWPAADSSDASWRASRAPRAVRVGPPLAARLAMALPLLALMMVLAFHLWFFFLLIPLSGAVVRTVGGARYQRYGGRCRPGWR